VYVHATSATYNLSKLLHKFIFQHIDLSCYICYYIYTNRKCGGIYIRQTVQYRLWS